MAKRGKKQHKKRYDKPAAKPALPNTPAAVTPAATLASVEEAAMAQATEADIEAMAAAPAPASLPLEREEDLVKRASEVLALLESQRKRVGAAEAEVTKRSREIDARAQKADDDRAQVKALEDDLSERDLAVSERERTLQEDEADLLRRHEEIAHREADADAGFSRRNREALAQLEAEGEALREQFSRHRKQIDDERAAFERDLQEKRDQFATEVEAQREKDTQEAAANREANRAELSSQREELAKESSRLASESKRLRKLAADLDLDRELLDEDRKALDEKVAQRTARAIELKDSEIQALAERLDVARAERDRYTQLLADREEADRRFGGETPEEVLKRLRALEEEREQLRKALGGRPSAEAAQRLEELERQKELWESDRLQLLAELGEARQEAARKRIAVTELESLRDEKRSLESANALLHEANSQLRTEVDALVKGVEGKSPFPSCSAMDSSNELQATRPSTDTLPDLAGFAEYVRHRMAWDPKTGKELYYSAEDVRSFLGGLAMSRLHLLQGISGTGKTSLPLAFARAIGAGSALIEVQAGWRDRQDLIGHFNTFERRFYESEFLQAMYRASTPLYRDTPFIIVLDEMNLSHPEQYFADLLSALEQDRHRQRLVLMTAAVDPAPNLLTDGGTKMLIPPNVWFIGTANHDETTKDFADKTYDRAHVIELPSIRKAFERQDHQPQNPVSLSALEQAFAVAMNAHQGEAAKAYDFLQTELGDTLRRRFRVGWGNRLERQMSFYVPVVVAAEGTLGEATDHILATKLLRKIRDRHDNRPEDIIALRERIQTGWSLLDKKGEPLRSLALLRQELQRLGHDED
ncbi:MAG: AAA family ATPase [Deferrisomatales bacterium]|nr:AAA family ATPase [Deferrisomatales bacterium]